ncbi:MAG: hypothetical protein ABI725_02635 [Chloroflexota bacterium]
MGVRTWAAIGNVLKISAALGYLAAAFIGYRAFQLKQVGASGDLVLAAAAVTVLMFAVSILLWNLRGPLVSGNLIVRVLVGAYMLLWVISTLGLGLIFIGIVYLFTSEPDSSELFRRGKPPKPRFKAPAAWRPTGHVGASGATLYADENLQQPAGIFDSWTPVQVVDKRHGLAQVLAESGERGWIDLRTLAEGV